MRCPACGTENADGTSRCASCSVALDAPGTVTVRVSRVALASAILALITFAGAVPIVMAVHDPRMLRVHTMLVVASYGLSILGGGVGFLLGLIGWALIGSSGGRVTGRGFATIGVLIPLGAMVAVFAFDENRRATPLHMRCGTNLSAIGKAMLIYANDYDDKLPVAGGRGTAWGPGLADWSAENRIDAFGLDPNGTGGEASISSSLYLLVRYAEMDPKRFICPAERKTREFDLSAYRFGGKKLTDVWDFGPNPAAHCSYAYHAPYSQYPLGTSDHPNSAVAADRNPWIDSPAGDPKDFARFKPDIAPFNGTPDDSRNGNSKAHWDDGQNVLFLDSHVEFIKRPYQDPQGYTRSVRVENDNIYTSWDEADKARGVPPKPHEAQPADRRDSLLLNDPPRR